MVWVYIIPALIGYVFQIYETDIKLLLFDMIVLELPGVLSSSKLKIEAGKNRFGSGVLAVAGCMIMLCLMLTSTEGSVLYYFNSVNKANLKDYALFLVALVFLSVTLFALSEKIVKELFFSLSKEFWLIIFGVAFLFLSDFIRWNTDWPNWIWSIIIILVILILYEGGKISNTARLKNIEYMVYLFTILVWGISCGVVNIFIDSPYLTKYNVMHAGAYTMPLYWISQGEAFYGGQVDLYGHYGLFFKIPMMLFGNSGLVIGVVMGIAGMITATCAIFAGHKLISSSFHRIIFSIAVMCEGVFGTVYWQTHPHRLLFPMILLAYAVSVQNKELTKIRIGFGYFLCVLGMLWSNEAGIVCGIAWAVYLVLKRIENVEKSFVKAVGNSVIQIIVVAIEYAITILIVNVYNFFASGCDIAKLFNIKNNTGVLLENSYIVDFHMTLWQWGNAKWVYILITFAGLFVYALAKFGLFGKTYAKKETASMAMIAILGLGLMTFYVNRTDAGTSIVDLFWYFAIMVLLDRTSNCSSVTALSISGENKPYLGEEIIKILVHSGCVFFISCMLLGVQTSLDTFITWRLKNNSWNYEVFQDELIEFEQAVPENTWASGDGLLYLYTILGWDAHYGENPVEFEYAITTDEMPEKQWVKVRTVSVGDYNYVLFYNKAFVENN